MNRMILVARNLLIGLLALGLGGCGAVVVGGAVAGAAVVHDRRTTGTYVEDQEIFLRAAKLRDSNEELKQKTNINIDVYNLQVLLTGQAENMPGISSVVVRIIFRPLYIYLLFAP